MKKWFFALVVALLPVSLMGQVTASITTFFDIPKRFVAMQTAGLPLDGTYTNGDPDTLPEVTITGVAQDSVYGTGLGNTESLFRITVDYVNPVTGSKKSYAYLDTLRWNTQHIIPYQTVSGVPDSLFFIEVADSVNRGDAFYLKLVPVTEVRLTGDTLVTKPEFSATADSLHNF